MKRHSIFTQALLLATLTLAFAAMSAVPAYAQNGSGTIISSPIVEHPIQTQPAKPTKKTSTSNSWMKAEVLHADGNSMVVAEQGNQRVIHTFTYAGKVQAKMRKIVDKGNYQYGDKVKILYTPGSTVALKIHGKPSKSS